MPLPRTTRHVAAALAILAFPLVLRPGARSAAPPIDPTCSVGSSPSTFTSSALDAAAATRSGVTYNSAKNALELQRAGGVFTASVLGITDLVSYACAGDFDEDGWDDFVGASDTPEFIRLYENRTYENPAPLWDDPGAVRTPKFVATTEIQAPVTRSTSRGHMVCADFNNDGNMDFVYARIDADQGVPTSANLYRGNGDGTFAAPYQFVAALSTLQKVTWMSTNAVAVDYNGDGWLDLIWGAGTNASSAGGMTSKGGDVLVLLNDHSGTTPHFTYSTKLLTNAGYNFRGPVALTYLDFTGDGVRDLVVSGPSTNKLALYPGLLGGGVSSTSQTITFSGGATVALAADFSLDGRPDLIVGTDNFNWPTTTGYNSSGHEGGKSYYYKSDADGTPFSGGVTQQLTVHAEPHDAGLLYDFDTGFVLDYDHDPESTPDFVIADGNHAANYYVFANRTQGSYATCGTVSSSVLDIGALAAQEMTATEVRLDPSSALNGGTITWEASNDNGTTWTAALACADDPSELCAGFPTTVGNQIRWRATMCSNATHTASPEISGVGVEFTYVTAENHFRAGPIARDGLIYVGAARQPGNEGHFFAMSDETGATLWDAGAKLDATSASARNIYTMGEDGTRYDFSTSSSNSPGFRATILAADAAAATTLVNWQRSARFGLTSPLSVMGAVETSTAALLTPPAPPYWYGYATTSMTERALADAYLGAQATRPQLLFVGSKDGALHAFRTDPNQPTATDNGTEAWAFIPYDVAQRMEGDRASGVVQAYPDGSPTLASGKIDGVWKTVLISGEANGGRSVYALDVTATIDGAGTVVGPTPLWSFTHPNMGNTHSKPAVLRVLIGGVERWLAVFASGKYQSDVGDSVYAVDLASGAPVWQLDIGDTNCYVASDITASETDDESGTAIDGYVDRVFFADNKGRVWKVDAASGAAVGPGVDVGLAQAPLFSTLVTPGALGADRAIAGAIAAAPDSSKRLVLYFGTGGTEDTPSNVQNAFFAVYADTGAVRSKILPAVGVKYYGGVAYNDGQLVLSTGADLAGLGLCAPTAGEILAIDAETFTQQFAIPVGSKMMAPVYVARGEFYAMNIEGQLVTSPYTPPTDGGGNSSSGNGQVARPFTIVSWRQIVGRGEFLGGNGTSGGNGHGNGGGGGNGGP